MQIDSKVIDRFSSRRFVGKISSRLLAWITSRNFIILITIALILTLKQLAFFDWASASNAERVKRIIYLFAVSCTLTAWTLPLRFKRQFISLIAVDIFITLVLISDLIYSRYYNTPISIPVLAQIGLAPSIKSSITSLFKLKDILLFIDFPLITVAVGAAAKLRLPLKSHNREFSSEQRLIAAMLLIVCSLSVIAFKTKRIEEGFPGAFTFDHNVIVRGLGVIYYHGFDLYSTLKNIVAKESLTSEDKKKISSFFDDRESPKDKKYSGIAKGRNLIIIQVEALQGFVIGKKIGGVEITPNLNKLTKEGLYFDNFYTQVAGGNTSDAEFLVNNSLYPVSQGAVYFRYPGNYYRSLPKLLDEKGYYSAAMHGYVPSFWNRATMYQSLGFDKFYSSQDYDTTEKLGMGISDKQFFKQSLDKLEGFKQPFYSFMVTLSSHHSFDMFENFKNLELGQFKGTQLGNYLKGIHYTDEAIGEFIQGLKEKGLYDNSLIVIYGDHNALHDDKVGELDRFLGFEGNSLERAQYKKVPLLIHVPGTELKGVKNIAGGQVDVLPTLLNLLGYSSKYVMGKDLLNIESNLVVFRNQNFTDGKIFYLSSEDKYYDLLNGGEYKGENGPLKRDEARKMLTISDRIISNNLLKNFP